MTMRTLQPYLSVSRTNYSHLEILYLKRDQQIEELARSQKDNQLVGISFRQLGHGIFEDFDLHPAISESHVLRFLRAHTSSVRMSGQKLVKCCEEKRHKRTRRQRYTCHQAFR